MSRLRTCGAPLDRTGTLKNKDSEKAGSAGLFAILITTIRRHVD